MYSQLNTPEKVTVALFILFSAWWLVLIGPLGFTHATANLDWAAVYQITAWWGGLYGIYSARLWGGTKSLMGRAILFFSIGLLLQAFGQTTFSIYTTILHVDIPYPSIADIGYFGSIPFYTLGMISIARISGASVYAKKLHGKAIILLLPLLLLALSYAIFLRGYTFNWLTPLTIFLDFGYPLGEALYVSVALLALLLSRGILGGIMKVPLTFLMLALIAQYFADFNFLYQAANSSWVNAGYGDFMYLFAYFLMGISLVRIRKAMLGARNRPA